MNSNIKVLFLCKKRTTNYGVSTGLLNSSQFIVNYLNRKGIEGKVITCVDANSIDREVHQYKPTHVIISAIWVSPIKLKELIKLHPRVQWQIRIHSKIPFIANEGTAFEWLLKYAKIDIWKDNLNISGNSLEFCEALSKSLNIDTIYLPNIYMPDYKPNIVKKINDGWIDIGCFGAIRPLKNQLIQAMAAIAFGNEINALVRFHINVDRLEQSGEQVLKNIRAIFKYSIHELVEHQWLSHEDFLKLVSTMDMGMQVSISETFNIVCADFIYMGIPIVVSKEIEWMDTSCAVDPLDIKQIIDMLHHVYNWNIRLQKNWNIWKLGRYNVKSGNIWLDYLNSN